MKNICLHLITIFVIGFQINIVGQTKADFVVSDNPIFDEFEVLFKQAATGELDPYEVLAAVIEKGNNAVPGLEEFLFTEYKSDSSTVQPNKVYAVMALDGIATKEATAVLFKAVNHTDNEVRAEVIKAFAFNSYNRIAYNENEDVKPDKEVLRILIENADDTTYSANAGKRIGEIAREGIKNWTGQDYGDLPLNDQKLKTSDGTEVNIKDYRKQAWAKNIVKMKWNADTKHFEMKE